MSQPVISIIIPMYNVSSSIERCVMSVLKNSSPNIEILCVDDGSRDNTVNIVKEILNYNLCIKLIENKHLGVSAARNTGIDNAEGKYIAFVDSDDAVDNNAFLKIESLLKKSEYDCLTFGGHAIGDSKRARDINENLIMPDATFYSQEILEDALFDIPSCNLFVWNKIFSAKIIQKNNIRFDTSISLGEDRAFIFDCFKYIESLKSISEQYYIYTADHQNSLTDKFSKAYYDKACSHLKVVEHIFKSWHVEKNISSIATKKMLNWSSRYVYRPQQEFYTDMEKSDIIKGLKNNFYKYYPNFNLEVMDDGIRIDS